MGKTEETVSWSDIKKEVTETEYRNSILPHIEKIMRSVDLKKITLTGGQIFSTSGKNSDGIFIILKGRIGIGGFHGHFDNYCVERLILKPFSFIGEIEAQMVIHKITYPQINLQSSVWVSSELLSSLIAFNKKESSIDFEISYNENTATNTALKYFLGNDHDNERFNSSEIELFAKKEKVILLKIPLPHAQKLWDNKNLRHLMYEDAFIKAKKFCYISDMQIGEKIIAIYNYAKLNDLLKDENLYIIGPERLNAITEDSTASKPEVRKNISDSLKNNGFNWTELKMAKERKKDKVIDTSTNKEVIIDDTLKHVWRLMSPGGGGNKLTYKISRV